MGTIFSDIHKDKVAECTTEKSKHLQRKNFGTAGNFFGMRPCGIILFVFELLISESKSQVHRIFHDVFPNKELKDTERIIYDDSCHLRKYCVNRILKKLTAVSKRLGKINMVVDKLQFRNLLDLWCKPNGNPHDRNELYGVNIEICEQRFAWITKYRITTRHMNQHQFLFSVFFHATLKIRK
ncbi:uncharacterized protein LOC122957885 [Acropora millepora]|uniref:uncharacterized protein LOC122957885 n=1 Tax=Acropora millepora TaxID=45264 RepID=UPI001CF5F40A|nr:uncharacterized protein LOC122957885 [Acropora millepora]